MYSTYIILRMLLLIFYLIQTIFCQTFPDMFSTPITTTQSRMQSIIHEENTRLCCPLSFCGSLEHTTVQDCDHPNKLLFVEPLHQMILSEIQEKTDAFHTLFGETSDEEDKKNYMDETMAEIYRKYLGNPISLNEEQLHILLFRLKTPVVRYWNVPYDDRIQMVLEAYHKTMQRFMEPVVIEENVEYPESTSPLWMEDHGEVPDSVSLERVFENEHTFLNEGTHGSITQIPTFAPPTWVKREIRTIYEGTPDEEMKMQECPICYEATCFVKTGCGHSFCDCLITYILRKDEEFENARCPCCREEIAELHLYNWEHTYPLRFS